MRQIGMDLIRRAQRHLTRSGEAPVDFDFRDGYREPRLNGDVLEDEKLGKNGQMWPREWRKEALKGRDLLSLLSTCHARIPVMRKPSMLPCYKLPTVKSNMVTTSKDRMSQDEILSQISTFMAAGHETTS